MVTPHLQAVQFEKEKQVKKHNCRKVKKVAKVSSITITKMQELQSIHPNDVASKCTGQKMPPQKFLRKFDDISS